jgi:hypothetical protein
MKRTPFNVVLSIWQMKSLNPSFSIAGESPKAQAFGLNGRCSGLNG